MQKNYIANDGFDCVYEYALINREKYEIVYITLSYPKALDLTEYKDYLKRDSKEYELESPSSLENFSIYKLKVPELDGWITEVE